MEQKVSEIIQDLNIALKKSFTDFEGLYLFGSHANGTYNNESDVDIVAIVDASDKKKRYDIWGLISELDYKYDIVIDMHPMTRQELERNYMFHNEVVKKGIFYAAA